MLRGFTTHNRRHGKRGRAKKVKGGGRDITTCWAKIFDTFAARYGLKSPDEFYKAYTLKQVTYLLRIIEGAKYEEVALQAKLHGLKMKPRVEALRLSEEDRAEADSQAESVLERMKKKYEGNNGR